MVQNIFLLFSKVLDYPCQIKILGTLVSLKSTSNVETALPLDAFRWQMPSAVILIYAKDFRSLLI